MSKSVKRIHAIVHGRVQGVFFRETTCQEAQKIGLSGWVRNLPDRTVETEFQGEKERVEQMLAWLPQGSRLSKVTRVDSREIDPVAGESGFVVTWL